MKKSELKQIIREIIVEDAAVPVSQRKFAVTVHFPESSRIKYGQKTIIVTGAKDKDAARKAAVRKLAEMNLFPGDDFKIVSIMQESSVLESGEIVTVGELAQIEKHILKKKFRSGNPSKADIVNCADKLMRKTSQNDVEKMFPNIPYPKIMYWAREKLGVQHSMPTWKYWQQHHENG